MNNSKKFEHKKINVITVHYNTQVFIENIVRLLKKETGCFFHLVVVDNSNNLDLKKIINSENIELEIVSGEDPRRGILESHRSALNLGLGRIKTDFQYTIFLDPDVVFTDQCVSRCIEYMKKNELDIVGVHKFYQYKTGQETSYPYIWFTIIKTEYLRSFSFQPVQPSVYRHFLSRVRTDTGDSIYSLAEKQKLKSYVIPKFCKSDQASSYPFLKIKTDDWFDENIQVAVSHYRGGSTGRKGIFHQESLGNDTQDFIEKSKAFQYSELFPLLRLNFGGGKKHIPKTKTVDILDAETTDIIHDLNKFPYPFSDNSVAYCLFDNVLEHLDNPIQTLKELNRILAPNGIIEIYVPYFKYSGSYQDPTHKHFFHENYFDYFTKKHALNYEVENISFRILKKELLIRKTGVLMNPVLLIRKVTPFKGLLHHFLWDIYDTVHIKLQSEKTGGSAGIQSSRRPSFEEKVI